MVERDLSRENVVQMAFSCFERAVAQHFRPIFEPSREARLLKRPSIRPLELTTPELGITIAFQGSGARVV